ncbi:MAG: 30S ribosomal protein S20 [Candidatus Harrisonbacteria bacterium RIFCSPLOWO2_01_FULL_40_28]|uniref:Small ribosomal subunit protein bS20 n=2 Tax=Candidatus Harrisoniibacteriota TaxID=1817905 RepID=A0A1G1ZW77_9BACT|nr:MAG: 30S ribosomal protein S20 [Candidatus Harrisonbacteria bacterium RIFCSPLOWO2_01_FULL_40_28]OGY68824.1 MAG: 30S ribosomal protein S20 [Candidatus Harrisonbacteria bacterium RIFOXYD1_FULL_40_9]
MPITSSAKKALRQNKRHNKKNLLIKKGLLNVIRVYKKSLALKNKGEAEKQLSAVYQSLDKTAKSGVIKPNKASRLKSRLSSLLKNKHLI